jgi:enoyl-CoA hydratase
MGLVQEVVPPGQALGRALELAAVMSTYPQASLRTDRLCAYQGLSLSLSEGLELEKRLHRGSLTDPNMSDGLERFITGQRPQPPRPPALS